MELIDERSLDPDQCMPIESTTWFLSCGKNPGRPQRCGVVSSLRFRLRRGTINAMVHKNLKPKEAFDLSNPLTAKG